MPRIRTIKPEYFRSPSTAACSFPARILYEALWCWADDFGIGETNIHGWLGFAFPDSDEISAQDLRGFCAEIAQHFEITFYIVRGRHFYAIENWQDHQKTERREERRQNPTPDDPDAVPDLQFQDCGESAGNCAGKPAQNPRKMVAGTGEQGNRGTGEEQTCATASRDQPASRFDDFWAAYPRRRDRRKAEKAFATATKRADADKIIDGACRYAQDPNRQEQYTKYAEGWLNGDGWLDEPLPARSETNGHPPHKLRSGVELAARLKAEEQHDALVNPPWKELE